MGFTLDCFQQSKKCWRHSGAFSARPNCNMKMLCCFIAVGYKESWRRETSPSLQEDSFVDGCNIKSSQWKGTQESLPNLFSDTGPDSHSTTIPDELFHRSNWHRLLIDHHWTALIFCMFLWTHLFNIRCWLRTLKFFRTLFWSMLNFRLAVLLDFSKNVQC